MGWDGLNWWTVSQTVVLAVVVVVVVVAAAVVVVQPWPVLTDAGVSDAVTVPAEN